MKLKKIIALLLILPLTSALSQDYRAKKIRGDVTVLRSKHHQAEQLLIDMKVPEDSSIVTQKNSFVQLTNNEGETINVGPNSKVVLQANKTDTSPSVLVLLKGALRNKVKHSSEKIKQIIKTRNVSMGVRGTEYSISYSLENDASSIVTYEGQVVVEPISPFNLAYEQSSEELSRSLENSGTRVSTGEFFAVKQDSPTEVTKIAQVQIEQIKAKTNYEDPSDVKISVREGDILADMERGEVVSAQELLVDQSRKIDLKISQMLKENEIWEYKIGIKPILVNSESKQTIKNNSFSLVSNGLGIKTGIRGVKNEYSTGFNFSIAQMVTKMQSCSNCYKTVKREEEEISLFGTNLFWSKDLDDRNSIELGLETEQKVIMDSKNLLSKKGVVKVDGTYSKVLVGKIDQYLGGNISAGGGSMSGYGSGMNLGLGISGVMNTKSGNTYKVFGGVNSESYGKDETKYESRKYNIGVGIEF